jgi:type VI secretion system protein VasD
MSAKLTFRNNKIIYIILVILISVLTGCSRNLQVSLIATSDVNNGGNPVVVRVYQLRNDVNFQRATIESFWNDDVQTLGGDLIGDPVEVIMRPDETRQLHRIKIENDALYIGAAADFYRPDQNRWRHILDISNYRGKKVYVLIGNDKLAVSPPR